VSDQQSQQVLRLMNRPPEARLTPEVAREICERTSSAAVLEGSIAGLGNQYVLWLRARNCRSGEVLAEEQAQPGRKEEVLNALSRMVVQIRTRLGESRTTVQEHSTPLEQATTSSLEALKAYSAGRNAAYVHGQPAAIPHLQRAIAIDPQFAMAYADLSIFSWNMGQTDLAAEYTRKAYALRDRVSDRERLWILFLYDRQVTGNLQRELQTLESWVQTYPRDSVPLSVLAGWGTMGTGQYERAIQAVQQDLRLNPDDTFAYGGLALHNLFLDRFAEAADALRQASERKLETPDFLVLRYYLAFFKDDQAGMEREIARARGEQGAEDWMSHNQALVLARSGQIRRPGSCGGARSHWRCRPPIPKELRSTRARKPSAKRISGMRLRPNGVPRRRSTSQKGAMWSIPRRLRWRSQATAPDRKGSPRTWQNDSQRILRCNSSIFTRCARFSHSRIRRR
jgi:tetratricopeptide (TPR) repeat protein